MRIRTIKPEFWGDEKMAPLDALTRLVFLGIISIADDAGRLLDSVKMIDGILFAYTDDSCREPLATLARMGRIERGETASGQRVIQIANWHHQKIDHPNLKGALPPITQPLTEPERETSEPVANHSRGTSDPISTSTYDQLPVPEPSLSPAREDSKVRPDTVLPPEVLDFCQRQQNPAAWLASLVAMQKGVGAPSGKAVTAKHIAQACLEIEQLGGEVTPRRFRRVLEQVTEPKYVWKDNGKSDDAEFVAAANRLQEITSYRDPVRANSLTAEGWLIVTAKERAAIKAIGTMERVLTAKPQEWPWVVRDFVKAQRGMTA